jgi:hypothetical protein
MILTSCSLPSGLEDDDVVDAVQELGPEVAVQCAHHLLGCFFEILFRAHASALQERRADVRGHDEDGVLEIDHAAFAIGEAAVVHHLQQDVEDVGMRLFDFVEEHDA